MKVLVIGIFLLSAFLIFGCKSPVDPTVDPEVYDTVDPEISETDYSCNTADDCVHTCGKKCVNAEWVASYEDTCVNFRAYDCSCVENICYSDGQPPIEN